MMLSQEFRIRTFDFWRLFFATNGCHDDDFVFLCGLIKTLRWRNQRRRRLLTALLSCASINRTIRIISAACPNRAHPFH